MASPGDAVAVPRQSGVTEAFSAFVWMHAYRRDSPRQILDVLRHGPTPPSVSVPSSTRQAELDLGMPSGNVYAYLGRTRDAFGACAFAVPISCGQEATATLSPFDTGGLRKHIKPVAQWDAARQRRYLSDYSWPGAQLPTVLTDYPGENTDAIRRYLDPNQRPAQTGPAQVWAGKLAADIWSEPDASWPAWTWECRWSIQIPVGGLLAWTCSPADYDLLLQEMEDTLPDADRRWLMERYVRFGVSFLVKRYRDLQVPQ